MIRHFPSTHDETLVASGEYIYRLNGDRQAVSEPWSHHTCGSEKIIRSRRLALDHGVEISTMCKASEDWNAIESAEISAEITREAGSSSHDLSLDIESGKITSVWQDTEEDHAAYCCFPLLRIYMGGVLRALHASEREDQVLIPNINNPNDQDGFLKPVITTRSATLLRTEIKNADGRDMKAALYEYTGDQYDAGALFWVDEHGVLIAYEWQQSAEQSWACEVSNYRRLTQ